MLSSSFRIERWVGFVCSTTSVLFFVGLVGVPSPAVADDALRLTLNDASLEISAEERPLVEYRYVASPFKPYLKRWFTPGGINVLRDAPDDHLHHHGLMYAVGVDGADFWGEKNTAGRQVHRGLDGVKTSLVGGVAVAAFTQKLDWMASGEERPRLRESRTIEVCREKNLDASLLTWTTELQPGPGRASVQLDGSAYFGLGMRFVRSMDTSGKFINFDEKPGERVRGTEQLLRSRWCAYNAEVDGKPVTVAVFDHPENARHPATWFTMTAPFAYLSATLNLHREPLRLGRDRPLELTYGVALWDGEIERSRIEELYKKWLSRSSPKEARRGNANSP